MTYPGCEMAGQSYEHHCPGESWNPQHVYPAEAVMHVMSQPHGAHGPQRLYVYDKLTRGKMAYKQNTAAPQGCL